MKREYEAPTIEIIEFETHQLLVLTSPNVEVYEDEEYPIGDAL